MQEQVFTITIDDVNLPPYYIHRDTLTCSAILFYDQGLHYQAGKTGAV